MSIVAKSESQVVPSYLPNGQIMAKIHVFRCFTALNDASFFEDEDCQIEDVIMPCSSATREVFLLRAFESGADAVIVLVCPEGTCRYLQGNLRAVKRVARVKKLLDEIGLDGRRLSIYNITHGDREAVERIIQQTMADLASLGPNPAK